MIGAIYGRLIGEVMLLLSPASDWNQPGIYALIGSASFVAGVTRLTLSLTVLYLEMSGDLIMAFPLVLATTIAKLVGDLRTHGFFKTMIELKALPYLNDDVRIGGIFSATSQDVMAAPSHRPLLADPVYLSLLRLILVFGCDCCSRPPIGRKIRLSVPGDYERVRLASD